MSFKLSPEQRKRNGMVFYGLWMVAVFLLFARLTLGIPVPMIIQGFLLGLAFLVGVSGFSMAHDGKL